MDWRITLLAARSQRCRVSSSACWCFDIRHQVAAQLRPPDCLPAARAKGCCRGGASFLRADPTERGCKVPGPTLASFPEGRGETARRKPRPRGMIAVGNLTARLWRHHCGEGGLLTVVSMWHVLVPICFLVSIGGATISARLTHLGASGYALAAGVGVIVGFCFAGTMWVTAKRVHASSSSPKFVVALYLAAIPWIIIAGLVGQWASSALLHVL